MWFWHRVHLRRCHILSTDGVLLFIQIPPITPVIHHGCQWGYWYKNMNVVSALLEKLYKQSLNPDFCSFAIRISKSDLSVWCTRELVLNSYAVCGVMLLVGLRSHSLVCTENDEMLFPPWPRTCCSVKYNTIWFLFQIPDMLTWVTGDLCNVWHVLQPLLNSQSKLRPCAFFNFSNQIWWCFIS